MKELVIELYELFFTKTSGYRNYVFEPSEVQLKTIDNFLKLVDKEYGIKSVGYNFLFDYFSFAFSQRYDQKTRFGKGIVQLNHVVGKKQFESWLNRDENWKYFTDIYLDKVEIKKKEEKSTTSYIEIYIEEEKVKRESFNTLQGLLNCIDRTTLYNPKSILCRTCSNKTECIDVLRSQLPKIYKKRF